MTPDRRDAGAGDQARLLLLIPTSSYRTEAFVDAAHRLGVPITVASERDSAFSAPDNPGLLTLDFANPRAAADAVRDFAGAHPISAVVGVDDGTVVAAARIGAELGLPHNPTTAVMAAGDKYRQREALRAAAVPIPRFHRVSVAEPAVDVAGWLDYPAVVKPIHLSASRGVMRVDSPGEFLVAHARLAAILAESDVASESGEHYLVEEYVDGPEFALEGLLIEGRLHVLALFDKPDPLTGPFFEETIYVTPSRAPSDVQAALIACGEEAVRALGLVQGPVHVEMRHNGAGAWLIELAARSIGGRCARALRFGADGQLSLEDVLLGAALDRLEAPPAREQAAAGVMMIPIPCPGWLSRVDGVDAALAVRNVRGVEITAHRGQHLRTLPEESRYLGFIFAGAADPARVEAALREAYGELSVVMGSD